MNILQHRLLVRLTVYVIAPKPNLQKVPEARIYFIDRWKNDLIFVEFVVNKFVRSLLLKRDDDKGDEDVDEEEWKDNEVDNVEDGHLHTEVGLRTSILVRRVHWVN